MSHTAITTTKAPAAISPYSQAIALGNAVYTSGMLPIDAEGNLKEGASACELICFSCSAQPFTGATSS